MTVLDGSSLLQEDGWQSVLAFLPIGDPALQKIAARVGLVPAADGEDVWLELGFADAEASHW